MLCATPKRVELLASEILVFESSDRHLIQSNTTQAIQTVNPRPREMSSVEYESNKLPAATSDVYANLDLSYVGVFDTTGLALTLTLVDASLNGGDPCVEHQTGAVADLQHTPTISVGSPRSAYEYCPPNLCSNMCSNHEFGIHECTNR